MSYADIVIALEFAPLSALDIPQAWLQAKELEARAERLLRNAEEWERARKAVAALYSNRKAVR